MKELSISRDLANQYHSVRNSYYSAIRALQIAIPEYDRDKITDYYSDAIDTLIKNSVDMAYYDDLIKDTLGITSFESISINVVSYDETKNETNDTSMSSYLEFIRNTLYSLYLTRKYFSSDDEEELFRDIISKCINELDVQIEEEK